MATAFDPYYKWLGIPPEEQPPNHYRLLGLRNFEHDADVIEAASEQRMLLLRSRQTGPQAELCQRLLNEIAAARVCLLDAELRRQYNEVLRSAAHERAISAPPPPLPAPHTDFISQPAEAGQEIALRAPPAPVYIGEGRVATSDEPSSTLAHPPSLPRPKTPPPVPQRMPIGSDSGDVLFLDEVAERAVDAQVIDSAPPVDSWHVQTADGSYWGPVPRSELVDWAAKGRITRRCKLLPVGTSDWLDAEQVLSNLPPAPPDRAKTPGDEKTGVGFRCPRCGSEGPPRETRDISTVGWVVFALLLVMFAPLCFVGLLMTETKYVCRQCGLKTS